MMDVKEYIRQMAKAKERIHSMYPLLSDFEALLLSEKIANAMVEGKLEGEPPQPLKVPPPHITADGAIGRPRKYTKDKLYEIAESCISGNESLPYAELTASFMDLCECGMSTAKRILREMREEGIVSKDSATEFYRLQPRLIPTEQPQPIQTALL